MVICIEASVIAEIGIPPEVQFPFYWHPGLHDYDSICSKGAINGSCSSILEDFNAFYLIGIQEGQRIERSCITFLTILPERINILIKVCGKHYPIYNPQRLVVGAKRVDSPYVDIHSPDRIAVN